MTTEGNSHCQARQINILQAKIDKLRKAAQRVVDAHDPKHDGSVEWNLMKVLEETK